MIRHRSILFVLGVLLLAAVAAIARLGDLGERTRVMLPLWGAAHAAYLAAAWLILRRPHPGRSSLPWILGVGLLARALFIPTEPTLSGDVYRYLWDGRLVAHGLNPFSHAPSDPALERFHSEIFHHLNHADVPTIYPPAAQILFGVTALVSATPAAWKLFLLVLETALILALLELLRRRGLSAERILLYYWNPLVLVESFGSGHLDLAAAAFLLGAIALQERRREIPAGISFAFAVLTKYVPGVLAPWLLARRRWALLGAALVAGGILTLPFLGAGGAVTTGLRIYARHWEFNGALYRTLREITGSETRIREILAGVGVLTTLGIAWRARSAAGAAYAALVAFLILSPTVFPWYAVPAVALLPLYPDPGMLLFSGLLALSYLPLPVYRDTGLWTLPGWILWIEYGGLLAAWAGALVSIAARRLSLRPRRSAPEIGVDE